MNTTDDPRRALAIMRLIELSQLYRTAFLEGLIDHLEGYETDPELEARLIHPRRRLRFTGE